MRPFCFAVLAHPALALVLSGSVFLSCAAAQPGPDGDTAQRNAPPKEMQCDRNLLTSYTGRVSGYRRDPSQLWLQISTDWDTVEELTVNLAEPDSVAGFQLNGTPLGASGWPAVEQAAGVVRQGMRVTAWVCSDGQTPPLVNWQPGPEKQVVQ